LDTGVEDRRRDGRAQNRVGERRRGQLLFHQRLEQPEIGQRRSLVPSHFSAEEFEHLACRAAQLGWKRRGVEALERAAERADGGVSGWDGAVAAGTIRGQPKA
jgi:hypothetical protein